MTESSALRQLAEHGVSIWLDDLSRRRLATGDLQRLVTERCVVGVTTNPAILRAAILGAGSKVGEEAGAASPADEYAADVAALAAAGHSPAGIVRALATDDVRVACDLLSPLATAAGDGRVSIEVDPHVAHDAEATIAEARALWADIDRANVFVKIPATPAGLVAIRQCIAEGISVNVTLLFSQERYLDALDAVLSGLEDRHDAGAPLAGVASVLSFFVSRIDTAVDAALTARGDAAALALRGRAAIAHVQGVHAAHSQVMAGARWAGLRAVGASAPRPLWASTGVKNPAYPSTLYVSELVAPGTVNTMPEATLEAFAAGGRSRGDVLAGQGATAQAVLVDLADVGVDLPGVRTQLEADGLRLFVEAWDDLLAAVATRALTSA